MTTSEGNGRDVEKSASLVRVAERAVEEYETVELPDGRDVAYAEFGDPDGDPVLVCHGWPSTRVMAAGFHDEARTLGLRLVCPDRPGLGGSDPRPGGGLTDWPGDAMALLDALGVERVPVLGVSGGGPYAAASARLHPDRVSAVSFLASVGPPETFEGELGRLASVARYLPPVARVLLWWNGRGGPEDPAEIAAERATDAPAADAEFWRSDLGHALAVSARLAVESGTKPIVRELASFARPWGFDLESIAVPAACWHGEADENAPVEMGRHLAGRIPDCRGHFLEGEGHLSLPANHGTEILRELLEMAAD